MHNSKMLKAENSEKPLGLGNKSVASNEGTKLNMASDAVEGQLSNEAEEMKN